MSTAVSCRLAIGWLLLGLAACSKDPAHETPPGQGREFVVVYSSIDELRTAPLYRAFTAETGIRIQQVTADDDRLLQMMLDKAQAPAADFYLASGAARLWRAADAGVLRPTHADDLSAAIPPHLRDPEYQWFGLAVTANVMVFNAAAVSAEEIAGYEALADPAWRGRLCLSSSALAENNALIALLIERHGLRQAELLVRQLLANLALPVFGDPQALLAAVESGRCTAGIANLEAALARLDASPGSGLAIASPVSGGTQVDIAGAGVTRHAGNAAAAARLLRWLSGPEAQATVADSLSRLPAVPTAVPPQRYLAWQGLPHDATNVARLGMLHQDAADLAERARYP